MQWMSEAHPAKHFISDFYIRLIRNGDYQINLKIPNGIGPYSRACYDIT